MYHRLRGYNLLRPMSEVKGLRPYTPQKQNNVLLNGFQGIKLDRPMCSCVWNMYKGTGLLIIGFMLILLWFFFHTYGKLI